MRGTRRLVIGSAIAVALALIAFAWGRRSAPGEQVPLLPFTGPRALSLQFDAATRLLVIAPHPDDETIAAAGLIRRVVRAGGAVGVVLLTSGDAFPEGVVLATRKQTPRAGDFRAYARTREAETTHAMERLGVERSRVRFLGFPDGGLCLLASSYLSAKTRAYESPYTGRREPPASEQVIRDVEYRGADVRRELEAVIAGFDPNVVAMPAVEDDHPDHCATGIFTREALNIIDARRRTTRAEVHYLVHNDNWPNQNESPSSELHPPAGFDAVGQQWRTFKLTSEEAALKHQLLGTGYPSQAMVIGRFLRSFARQNELFLEGRPTVSPECWCDDTHVATELPPDRYRRRHRPRK